MIEFVNNVTGIKSQDVLIDGKTAILVQVDGEILIVPPKKLQHFKEHILSLAPKLLNED